MGLNVVYISILLGTVYHCIPNVKSKTTIDTASRHDLNLETEFELANQNLSSQNHKEILNDEPFQPSFFYGIPELKIETKTNITTKLPSTKLIHRVRKFTTKEPLQIARSSEEVKLSNNSWEVTNSSQSAKIEEKLESPNLTNKLPRSYENYDLKSETHNHHHHPQANLDLKFPSDQHSHNDNYNYNSGSHHRYQHSSHEQKHQDHPQQPHNHNNHHGYYGSGIPLHVNEINQGYVPHSLPVDLKEEHYHYEDPYYSLKSPPQSPKHIEAHVSLGIPTIKPGIRDSETSYIGPAFSRALKFWLPSALLLTGASVLFPKRIHVPTDEQPLNYNYRPKRNANFGSGELELIPSVMLHQEHSEGPGHYVNNDHTRQENQPMTEQQQSTSAKAPAYRISYTRRGRFINNNNAKKTIPEFVPIPNSKESDEKGSENLNRLYKFRQNQDKGKEGVYQNIPLRQKVLSESGKKVIVVLRTKKITGRSNSTSNHEKDVLYSDQVIPNSSNQKEVTVEVTPFPTKITPSQDSLEFNNTNLVDQSSILVQTALKTIQAQGHPKEYDLTSNGPVLGLLNSVIKYEYESEDCQKRALCELAIRGTNPKATRFETFMWSLATLVPDAFTYLYDLDDVFRAIRVKNCANFLCDKPNLDIQE